SRPICVQSCAIRADGSNLASFLTFFRGVRGDTREGTWTASSFLSTFYGCHFEPAHLRHRTCSGVARSDRDGKKAKEANATPLTAAQAGEQPWKRQESRRRLQLRPK